MSHRIAVLCALMLLVLSSCIGDGSDTTGDPTEVTQPGPASPVAEQTVDVAATAQAESCAVTPPTDAAPGGWRGNIGAHPVWYQGSGIWIAPLSPAGLDPTLSDGTGDWFTGGLPVTVLPPDQSEPVEITGQEVDGRSDAVEFDVWNAHATRGVTAVLTIPTPGCWELEISAGESTFPLTVYVVPYDARADIAGATEAREWILGNLYLVPASCAVTEPTLADPDMEVARLYWFYALSQPELADPNLGTALYWFYGDGIEALVDPPAVFWAGELIHMAWYPNVPQGLEIRGQLQNDPSIILRTSLDQQTGVEGIRWVSTLVFPTPGCWELSASTAEGSLEATIYVYPFECRHEPGDSISEHCQPPSS